MDSTVQDRINEQIKHELDSAYIYLAMTAHFEAENLPGFAHWMRLQAREEVGHAMRLFDYVNDRGGRVTLRALDEPASRFDAPISVFRAALEHERHITGLIHELYQLAVEKRDFATQAQLQWFITEQVEEEKSASTIVEQLEMAGDSRAALLYLDRQLGARAADD